MSTNKPFSLSEPGILVITGKTENLASATLDLENYIDAPDESDRFKSGRREDFEDALAGRNPYTDAKTGELDAFTAFLLAYELEVVSIEKSNDNVTYYTRACRSWEHMYPFPQIIVSYLVSLGFGVSGSVELVDSCLITVSAEVGLKLLSIDAVKSSTHKSNLNLPEYDLEPSSCLYVFDEDIPSWKTSHYYAEENPKYFRCLSSFEGVKE